MYTYFPIIYNPNANQLQELPLYSKLDLSQNSIGLGTFYDSNNQPGALGQYLTVDAGGVVWSAVPPTASSDGITILKDSNIVGTAFSFNQLNFLGDLVGITSGTTPFNTALITVGSYWNKNSTGISTLVGNVGIGSTLPTSKLTVQGDVLITGILTASQFIGTVSTATTSTNINISATTSTDTTTSVVLVGDQTTGGQAPFIDSGLTYNANTNNLSASIFSGDLSATNATITNLSGTIGTVTNLNSSSLISTVGVITNLNTTNLSGTIGTITTLTGTTGTITNLNTTNLSGTIGTITTLNTTTLTGSIGTITNLTSDTGTISNLNFINLSGTTGSITNLTSTNVSGTIGTFTNLNTTNLSGTIGTITRLVGTLGTVTNLNTTNLTGTIGTIANLSGTIGTITNLSSTNLSGTIGTITNLNSTNFSGTIGTITNFTATNLNVTAGVATLSSIVVTGVTSTQHLNVSGVATVGSAVTISSAGINVSSGIVTASSFVGNGSNVTGIVTQISAGIGITISSSQSSGKGKVEIFSYKPTGKTIFVSQNGSDTNTGLAENHPKRTIKAAAAIAFPGDTIKVFPGVYIENNPIVLQKTVSVEGTELRNCVVTPKNLNRDLFYVNNGCHLTDLSFVGAAMTDGAAVVALQPLLGVSTDRFFDAARMIRFNLDYIASEAVGYLTSTSYKNPPFVVVNSSGIATDPVNCKDDIKDVFKSVIHDITRGGNSKCVGAGKSYYTAAGALQHITGNDPNGYSVKTATIDAIFYAAGIAKSCINNVTWNGNHQTRFTQVKDLGMQNDSVTGSNQDINSCANVVSAIYSCVGVVTSIIGTGLGALGGVSGIKTTYPANAGIGTTAIIGITTASYNNTTGDTVLTVPNFSVKVGDFVELRDLKFSCESGAGIGTTTGIFPSGKYGYLFKVTDVNSSNTFVVNTGVSSISHTYVSGGFVVNRAIGITTAAYSHTSGITTITAPGASVKVGDFVTLRDLQFSCTSGAATTTLYPTGNLGYEFKVTQVIGIGQTFVVNTGVSTIAHTYVGGGFVYPPYSPGVGPITQGPYIRNCTNFISDSIGMKVDGFAAEPGDQDDIGVTGTMSVDSYTQYNQGGIGVSITNGAYAQLVSIFTICDDIAIYTASGGQCDITNSNSSFGNYGLYATGVGNSTTKSIYRSTGIVTSSVAAKASVVSISGVGTYRPYDGQVCYFGDLYYFVDTIQIDGGGSGYTVAPKVTISAPTGSNGVRAQASTTIENGSVVSVNLVNSGTQYLTAPTVTIDPPPSGTTATASVSKMQPIYYRVRSATLPNAGVSTVTLLQTLNNNVSAGTTVYFSRGSLQLASTISFEHVGAGTNIFTAKPALGGVVIPENQVVQENGGIVVYTSTDQGGNFKIGDGVIINQATGQIGGRDFTKALFTTMTPFILALSD